MATKEMMTIINRAEKNLKNSVEEQIKIIDKQFKNLVKFSKQKDYKLIVEIFELNDLIQEMNHKAQDRAIENFMKAPLGKDLRRNVAYMMISRSLKDISHNAVNIAKYINAIQGKKISKAWVNEISSKIERRVSELLKLIQKEDIELANKLIERDASINKAYKKLLATFEKSAQTKLKLSKEEKEFAMLGFIMAAKNFEAAGDGIKEIAESIKFISTGKFN